MGRNLAAIYGLMGPMGNQLQFLLTSPAHSLLLSMFLNPSSSTLAKSTSLIPSIHLYPSSSSLLHLYSTFYFYPIRAHYTLRNLLPLCLKRSQMLLYECQSRSVTFSASVTGSGPLWKKERGTKEESHRVQESTDRGKTKKYHQHAYISYYMCAWARPQACTHASTHTDDIFMPLSFVGML